MKTVAVVLWSSWIILLASCGATQAIYGVPEDQWNRMTEKEHQVAIERFKRQAEINAQTRVQAEQARQEAEEFANKCHQDQQEGSVSEECKVTTKWRWWPW